MSSLSKCICHNEIRYLASSNNPTSIPVGTNEKRYLNRSVSPTDIKLSIVDGNMLHGHCAFSKHSLKRCLPEFLSETILRVYHPGDEIIKFNESARDVFLLYKGIAQKSSPYNDTMMTELSQGSLFGYEDFSSRASEEVRRKESVIAKTKCLVAIIRYDEFKKKTLMKENQKESTVHMVDNDNTYDDSNSCHKENHEQNGNLAGKMTQANIYSSSKDVL